MKPLYNKEQFDNTKSTETLPLQCYCCSKMFHKDKKEIVYELKNKRGAIKFCSKDCSIESTRTLKIVNCVLCNKEFKKKPYSIEHTKNNFCSKSCAAVYNNTHKKTGTRRSKLELYLEKQLTEIYPELLIDFNKKDAINSELDIYIPSLKLAFELNGIFHYEPIYGVEKLQQIQNNDDRKFQACLEKGISLCIIDTSELKYFKLKNIEKYKNIIFSIIEKKKTNI